MKHLFIALILLTNNVVFAQKLNKPQQRNAIYDILNEYYPEGKKVLTELANSPKKFKINRMNVSTSGNNDKPEEWVSGSTYEDVVNSMGTVIHETIHGYTSQKALQLLSETPPQNYDFEEYSAFYVNSGNIYLVMHTEVYSSNELKKDIPKGLRTFRYNPYIEPRSKLLGSQAEGIYGLLDEFNAYLQGSRADHALLPYFEENVQNKAKSYQQYVQNISSSLSAFYEFKYFILSYLLRAQKKYPDLFEKYMNNEALRQAYTSIHQEYVQLIMDYKQELENIINWASEEGLHAYIEDHYLWIDGYGVGINTEDMNKLKPILAQDQYQKAHNNFIIN